MAEPNKNVPKNRGNEAEIKTATLEELLQDVPLYSPRLIYSLFTGPKDARFYLPAELRLHCAHENCEGVRRHEKVGQSDSFIASPYVHFFGSYKCTDCKITTKVFGVKAAYRAGQANSTTGTCVKIYQEPAFGHPIPKRLFKVIGEENRENFLQARRAIGRGLGIGAYAYYRRIVESTKFALVDSILEIARATRAPEAQIKLLEEAQTERQFSKGIDKLRDVSAIPAVLLIEGHNPLTLLHDLLSEGIHKLSDGECLKRAQEAEVILCETADRMQIALTERKAVKAALSSIMSRKS